MKRGDMVTVGYQGRTSEGIVTMASDNGRALIVAFSGMAPLGMPTKWSAFGASGYMPILLDCNDVYRSLITNEPVTLTPDGRETTT